MAKKAPKKSKKIEKEQTSLYSYVETKKKKEAKKKKVGKKEIKEKTEEIEDKDKSQETTIQEKKEISISTEKSTKPIPEKLFYKEESFRFGLKASDIKLENILRENVTSKYLRYLNEKNEIIKNLKRGLLLDVDYDGSLNKAYCKFYDLDTDEIKIWIDTTNHSPYCITKVPKKDLENIHKLRQFPGFKGFEEKNKYDLLKDEKLKITKIYGKTPTDIGGSGNNIKNIIKEHGFNVWEADIRYHINYIFDLGLVPGMFYTIQDGNIEQLKIKPNENEYDRMIKELIDEFKDEPKELRQFTEENIDLFLTPIPNLKRLALDIEVNVGLEDYKIPDPTLAKQEIISISFVSSDGLKSVYVLERKGYSFKENHEKLPKDTKVIYFKNEKNLILETFRILWEYPIILTFNGDNFDLNYLFHRANRFKIDKDLNPIHVKRGFGMLARRECELRKGIHIDIFNFFINRSISGAAFGGKYQRGSLNAISSALLGREKYAHEEEIHDMEYDVLIWYNLKDSILTLDLTQFNNNLVWNLMILLCRITKLPIHEVIRRQISTWIQNLLYFEHRKKNFLIPRRREISEIKKGGFSKSITNGKRFQGAYVITPVPGIHFNVVVMDFSSLYPTIIKEYNLSYETVQCPHDDCIDNLIKGVSYHVCTHKMGVFAYVVGFFRDIRVKYFKPKSNDPSLSEEQRNYFTTIQQALKIFINGSYGVFGSENFPLYCNPVAESTTAIGRYSIKKTIEKAQQMDIEVLYGDTDSIFLLNPSKKQMSEISKWSKNELDLDLEEEKTYQFLALSERKKNYIGVYKDTKIVDIKGLVAKKKNTAEFIKKIFSDLTEILKTITNNEEFKKARAEIVKNIQDNLRKIGKPNIFSLDDYAINISLQKSISQYDKVIPQHVRALIELREYEINTIKNEPNKEQLIRNINKKYNKGYVVSFIKSKGNIGAKALEIAKFQDIDIKKYKELLQSALDQVLDALGISWEEIKGIKKMDAYF